MAMQCVILAGGPGLRMRPLTESLPKALLPVAGRPFLAYQLEWLARFGVSSVVLSTGYKGDQIHRYIENQPALPFAVTCVNEGDQRLGTGGALRLAYERNVLEERFLLLYGDAFLPIDFSKVWAYFQKRKEPALMTVLRNQNRWDHSNARLEGDKVTLYDKGTQKKLDYIDYGLSGMSRRLIEMEIPKQGACDLAGVFHRLSVRQELAGYEVHDRFFEIGSQQGLADFEAFVSRGMSL